MGLCQATCPNCRTLLFFPQEWQRLLLRCKTCRQILRVAPVERAASYASATVAAASVTGQVKPVAAGVVAAAIPGSSAVSAGVPVSAATASTPQAANGPAAREGEHVATAILIAENGSATAPAGGSPVFSAGPVTAATTPQYATQRSDRRPSSSPSLSPYEQILLRRRRLFWVKLGVAVMALLLVALVIFACWPYLEGLTSSWWAAIQHFGATDASKATTVKEEQGSIPTSVPQESKPSPTPQESKPGSKPQGTWPHPTKARNFDGRALLIGIQNYYYLNPVNSGAMLLKNADTQDKTELEPLGFRTFRRRLIRMGFRDECIGELSDVAAKNPNPPLKNSIEESLRLFVEESRPTDSILVAYVGHVLVVDKKVYLAPIDAKADGPPDKLIPLEWVYQQLGQCKARHKVLILDVAHFDPQEGVLRGKEMPLDPLAEEAIAKVPEGVLVWVSCSANQFSYSFGSYGLVGSVFFDTINRWTDISPSREGRRNRQVIEKSGPFPEWDLPLLRIATQCNNEVQKYVQSLGGLKQEPKLLGKLASGTPPAFNDPPPAPVTLKFAPLLEKPVDAAFVDMILKEVGARLSKDRPLVAAMLPPFWAKDLEKYKPDYSDEASLKAMLAEKPLRKVVFEAAELLDKHERSLRMSFVANPNVEIFRKEIMREQENLAVIDQELREFKEKLDKARQEFYDKETLRWRANFDLVYARFLGRMALYREYNYVLGNKLRKDPTLENPKENNGWKIVPSTRMQQKETRELGRERGKILERLLKEHPSTPWEFLAERERATSLGLKVEEARVSP